MLDNLKDVYDFLKKKKKFWMIPIIFTLLLFGGLLFFVQGTAVAPFIYTIF